jgi:hypothetical protein
VPALPLMCGVILTRRCPNFGVGLASTISRVVYRDIWAVLPRPSFTQLAITAIQAQKKHSADSYLNCFREWPKKTAPVV